MNREKFETKKITERVLKISLFGILIRLLMNAVANYLSFSESLHTIFVDASVDVFLSVASLFVLNVARKNPDDFYSYGYGKFEYVWNFLQGGFLVLINAFLMASTIRRFFNKKIQIIEQSSLVLMLASAILTAVICLIEYRGWKKTKSSIIYGNFLNHTTDVFVYVFGGIAVWGVSCGFQYFDWIIALIIAGIVGIEGFKMCRQSICELCDQSLPESQLAVIKEEIWKNLCFPLGWHCQSLRSRHSGNVGFLEVSLKVPEDLSLKSIQHHLDLTKETLRKKFPGLESSFLLITLKEKEDTLKN